MSNGPASTPSTFAHKYYFYGYRVDKLGDCGKKIDAREKVQEAIKHYEQKNFDLLLPRLLALEKAYPEEKTFSFYLALCYHYLKKKDLALAKFEELKGDKDVGDAASWYQALTYVLFNETENAIRTLSTIQTGPYAQHARALEADLT